MKNEREVLCFLLCISCILGTISSISADDGEKEEVKLRDEEDVNKLRDEALAKLEVPLERMKIKDLKQLLSDRGVTCNACSEKSQLVETVRSRYEYFLCKFCGLLKQHSSLNHGEVHFCSTVFIFQ